MIDAFHGFVLVDKAIGMSSFQAVGAVRRVTGVKKVGHAGTLDPFASGLLVIAIGRAFTKHIDLFQGLPKLYSGTMVLGQRRSTYDTEGEILSDTPGDILDLEDRLSALLPQFKGEISQVPPPFCAKKVDGKRAYKLARQGKEVVLEAQQVTIHSFTFDEIRHGEYPRVDFTVMTSKGTYIRSLAHDIGNILGCGGYLETLRRISIGPYRADDATPVDLLSKESVYEGLFREVPRAAS